MRFVNQQLRSVRRVVVCLCLSRVGRLIGTVLRSTTTEHPGSDVRRHVDSGLRDRGWCGERRQGNAVNGDVAEQLWVYHLGILVGLHSSDSAIAKRVCPSCDGERDARGVNAERCQLFTKFSPNWHELPCRAYLHHVMRRLSALSRPFVALFALWFAAVLGDPGVLHSCPMHGAHAGGTSNASAHAMHGSAASHHVGSHGSQKQTPTGPCTCVGHCCAAAAVAPLPTVSTFTVPVHVAQPNARPEFPSDAVPASPDLRLPFANGPPTV